MPCYPMRATRIADVRWCTCTKFTVVLTIATLYSLESVIGYQKVAINTACGCPSGAWCPPEWAYHADPSWCAPIANSQAVDHIQIATMAFSCIRGTCPAYFSVVCTLVQTVAERAKQRSAHHSHLIVPATKTKTFGSRSLRSAAPTVWNSLPSNILDINIRRGQFASGVRTWLFGCS